MFLQFGLNNNKLAAIWPAPTFTKLVDLPNLAAANWSIQIAGVIVYLLLLAVVALLVSFIISFYFSANTIIYSLMRYKVDNTALEDIYMQFDEAEVEPTANELLPREEPPPPEPESTQDESSSQQ